jgi:hypothetical protein
MAAMMPEDRYQYATKKSEMAITIRVGAGRSAPKLENTLLNSGSRTASSPRPPDAGHHDHRDWVEQRGLDLALDGEDLFLVGGDAVEQAVEDAGLLAGGDQVAEQGVEMQPGAWEGLRQVEPVSTSVRMSLSRRASAGCREPLMAMSKACSSGTPDFIMVASWRVNSAMSLSEMRPPRAIFCFGPW